MEIVDKNHTQFYRGPLTRRFFRDQKGKSLISKLAKRILSERMEILVQWTHRDARAVGRITAQFIILEARTPLSSR